LVAKAPFRDHLSNDVKLAGSVSAQQLQEKLKSLEKDLPTSAEPWSPEEDATLTGGVKPGQSVPADLTEATKALAGLAFPENKKRSILAQWFRLSHLANENKAAPASQSPNKDKGPAQPAQRPPDALPYSERVTYEVSPGVIESCTVIISGPNKGKYQDDRNPNQIFDNNQDWIRSKNANIPHSVGAS